MNIDASSSGTGPAMHEKRHRNARTTPETRAYIRDSPLPASQLARELSLSVATVHKWRERGSIEDRPHTPKRLRTTLTPEQETLAVLLRQTLALPLDDLLALLHALGCNASRSGLDRCLRRHGGERLPRRLAREEAVPGIVRLHWLRHRALPTGLLVGVDQASGWLGGAPLQTTRPAHCAAALASLAQSAPFAVAAWRMGDETLAGDARWLDDPDRYFGFRDALRKSAKALAARFASEAARHALARLLPQPGSDAAAPLLDHFARYNAGFRPRQLGRRTPLETIAARSARRSPTEAGAAAPADARPARSPQTRAVSLGRLPDLVGYAIRSTQLALFKDFEYELGALNLTPSAFSVLELLIRNPGLSIPGLARIMRVERASLAPVLDRLAALGLLQRDGTPGRRRNPQALPTAAGFDLHAEALARIARHEARALRGFSATEVTQLMDMLARISANLAAPSS